MSTIMDKSVSEKKIKSHFTPSSRKEVLGSSKKQGSKSTKNSISSAFKVIQSCI